MVALERDRQSGSSLPDELTRSPLVMSVEDCSPMILRRHIDNLENFESTSIWGAYQSRDQSVFDASGSLLAGIPFTAARQATGQWMGMFASRSQSEYVICSDFFGFMTLFYAFVPTGDRLSVHVSNSFAALAATLTSHGWKHKINFNAAGLSLITNSSFFRRAVSHNSLVQGIQILRPDEYIVAGEAGVAVLRASRYSGSAGRKYADLLESGIESSKLQIERSGELARRVVCDLSGGRDSRAVLSLLLTCGAGSSLEINTDNPRDFPPGASQDVISQDLDIAARIVEKFGLTWRKPRPEISYELNHEQMVDWWLQFKSNQSYEIRADRRTVVNVGASDLVLNGAGGELFRSYMGKSLYETHPRLQRETVGDSISVRRDLEVLFQDLVGETDVPSHQVAALREAFVHDIWVDEGAGYLDLLDSHYMLASHRYHLGNYESYRIAGKFVLAPLLQPEFLWASRTLAPKDRNNGRVLFDIIERCVPELNGLKFTTGNWPEEFPRSFDDSAWERISGNGALNAHSQSKISERVSGQQAGSDTEWSPYVENRFDEGLSLFMSLQKSSEDSSDQHNLIRTICEASDVSNTAINSRLMLLESIRQAIECVVIASETVLVGNRCSVKVVRVGRDKNRSQSYLRRVHEVRSVRTAMSLSEVTAELAFTEDRLRCRCFTASKDERTLEYAFYLYRNGQRVRVDMYTSNHSIEYPAIDLSSGSYRVDVFLRRSGAQRVQRVVSSNIVSV